MRQRRLWGVLASGLLMSLAACQGIAPEAAELVMPGDQGMATATLPDTFADRDYSFGGLPLCLASGHSVRVTKVSPVEPKGLTVNAFAIREHPTASGDTFGNAAQPLTEVGFDPDKVEISAPCTGPRPVELAVQVRRGKGTGSAKSLRITYTTDGTERTATVPFGITLCEGRDAAVPDCAGSASQDKD